jgi:hypothetical protein
MSAPGDWQSCLLDQPAPVVLYGLAHCAQGHCLPRRHIRFEFLAGLVDNAAGDAAELSRTFRIDAYDSNVAAEDVRHRRPDVGKL